MLDIEQQALQTFSKNLEYISKVDSGLSQKIAFLQQAIESGEYRENYALEYKEEGYFDVKNLHDGSWLYGANSNDISQNKANEIVYDKVTSVLSLAYRNSYSKETADDFEKFTAVNLTMLPPIEYILTESGGRLANINKIYKFAFLGLGLGLHVNMIDEKIKAASYLIVEDNLELFYLSLFVTRYYEINDKARLFFCVLENDDGFKKIFNDFLADLWIRNDFLKFSLFNDAYANKITKMQSYVLTRPNFAYPANSLFRKNIRLSKVLNEGYKFLNISQIYDPSPLKDKKVLYLAAGPSLSKYIKWVKQNRDKFIIIAAFMVSTRLKAEGITADIFIHIDENAKPIQNTLRKFGDDFSYFKDSAFILAGSVPLEFFTKLARKESIYLVEDRTKYKIGHGNLDFYSVGEAGYGLSLILGANDLYLLGIDLALDSKTGKTHADGHASSGKKVDLDKKDEVQEVGTMDGNVFSVPGNRGTQVPTTPLFAASISAFNNYSSSCLINNQQVYNLSDGAFLNGTIPLHVEDVSFDETMPKKEELISFLDNISTSELSQEEIDDIFIRKQEIKKKIKLIKKFATAKIKNKNDFYENYIKIAEGLTSPAGKNLIENSSIFTCYMEDISSFIGEYLNTKEADFSPATLNKIRNKLTSEFRRFIASFGYMDFDYLNTYSYFEPKLCKSLEKENFKLENFYSIHHSQAKEICFTEMLKNDIDGKLLEGVEIVPLEEKSGVGFLATYMNLFNNEYMEYLKKILTTLEDATLVAFYFEDYQKKMAEELFGEFGDKVEHKEVREVGDIVNGCRIIVVESSSKSNFSSLLSYFPAHIEDAISFSFNSEKINKTLHEEEEMHRGIYMSSLRVIDELNIVSVPEDVKFYHGVYYGHLFNVFNFKNTELSHDTRFIDFLFMLMKCMLESDKFIKCLLGDAKKINFNLS